MDLLDAAKCGVCLDLYADPRMLACGHTYCRACLDPTLHTIQGKVGSFFRCPECRKVTKQTEAGLPQNYTIHSMVDKIRSSPGSGGFGKCNGCRKAVLLGELFRCVTCKENSASAVDAEIRVCATCFVTSHNGHVYSKMDVASKDDYDQAQEKIDGYRLASKLKLTSMRKERDCISATIERLEKMLAKRDVLLTALMNDVNCNALTKAQLAEIMQQAEHEIANEYIANLLEYSRMLSEIAPPVPPKDPNCRALRAAPPVPPKDPNCHVLRAAFLQSLREVSDSDSEEE